MRSASAWSAKPAPRTSQKPLDSSGDESVIHFRLEVICDPKPYSLDLRERVVSYVEGGHSRRAAAAHFRVSPSFVINLMTAFRERGAVAPKALGGCDTASSIRTASSSCAGWRRRTTSACLSWRANSKPPAE